MPCNWSLGPDLEEASVLKGNARQLKIEYRGGRILTGSQGLIVGFQAMSEPLGDNSPRPHPKNLSTQLDCDDLGGAEAGANDCRLFR